MRSAINVWVLVANKLLLIPTFTSIFTRAGGDTFWHKLTVMLEAVSTFDAGHPRANSISHQFIHSSNHKPKLKLNQYLTDSVIRSCIKLKLNQYLTDSVIRSCIKLKLNQYLTQSFAHASS
jgi:hypothetical protein